MSLLRLLVVRDELMKSACVGFQCHSRKEEKTLNSCEQNAIEKIGSDWMEDL